MDQCFAKYLFSPEGRKIFSVFPYFNVLQIALTMCCVSSISRPQRAHTIIQTQTTTSPYNHIDRPQRHHTAISSQHAISISQCAQSLTANSITMSMTYCDEPYCDVAVFHGLRRW